MCKLYPYNAFTTAPGGQNPAAGRAALRARSSNVRARRYGDRLDEWWVDGRQPHVGASAAPGSSGPGVLGTREHPGARGARQRPERQRIGGGGSEHGERPRAPGPVPEVREEGGKDLGAEIHEEDRPQVGQEGCEEVDEEGGEAGREEGRAQARQEEGGVAERRRAQREGTQRADRAEASGEEARASLRQ